MDKLYDVNPFHKDFEEIDFEEIDPLEDFFNWMNFLNYRKEQIKKSRRDYSQNNGLRP